MLSITELRCEYRENPLGIDSRNPRFSWKLESDTPNTVQTFYQIQVAQDDTFTEILWDTDKAAGDKSTHHAYSGKELRPLTVYHVRAKAWDNHNCEGKWVTGFFETGFLGKKAWRASWITCDLPKRPPEFIPPWIMRRNFCVEKSVVCARAYATALGVYEFSLNGKRTDDTRLNPGWTSYSNWLQYQVYDLTSVVRLGKNVIEILLGEGWYSGDLTWEHNRNMYGEQNALLLEIHIKYDDGTEDIIVSDESFTASTGPILLSEMYNGEIYDARLKGSEFRDWHSVRTINRQKTDLVANINLPVRPVREIEPVALVRTPKGEIGLDMGQNMVGYIRFSVRGKAGDKVVLKHAEVLDKDGNFYFENLRKAKQEIVYILSGKGEETFEPHFTFQGFRYVKIAKYPGEISLQNFKGIVIHTDMKRTGFFECSDSMINQLQNNIVWSQRGNFVDVPTDCPQRDERLGWTADAQVFMPTACFNMDCALFFTKWLRDLRADQYPNGVVPFVIPDVMPQSYDFFGNCGRESTSATWGDAATIAPWFMYIYYGDIQVLEDSYSSMLAWVSYIRRESGDSYIWRTGPQIGDWLALDASEGSYLGATSTDYIATAYFALSVNLLRKIARVLNKSEDEQIYAKLFKDIKGAFRKEFLSEGHIIFNTQTAYILPLMFDLLDGREKDNAVESLVELIKENRFHLTTGFVGTPYLCHVLSSNGYTDIAYTLLFQEDYPSWLYQVKKGATTIWEHWDGIKEDGSMWSADMNSFNHYAYGSIGDWLYRCAAGINPTDDGAGFKKIILRPNFTDRLSYVNCYFDSLYGRIACSWKRNQGNIEMDIEIPPNTSAKLILSDTFEIHINDEKIKHGGIPIELGSGRYNVTCMIF